MGSYYQQLSKEQLVTLSKIAINKDSIDENFEACHQLLESNNNFLAHLDKPYVTYYFKLIKQITSKRQQINKEQYGDIIKEYNTIISKTALLIKELHLNKNPLTQYFAVSDLMHNGHLSYEGVLQYDSPKDSSFKDITGYLGMDVILGYGCCRHQANVLKDILSTLDNKTKLLSVSGEPNSPADHLIVILNDNKQYFGLESTYHHLYFFKPDGSIIALNEYKKDNPTPDYFMKLSYTYFQGKWQNLHQLRKYFSEVTKENYAMNIATIDNYEEAKIIAEDQYYNNYPLISDFEDDIFSSQEKIYTRLKQEKRY